MEISFEDFVKELTQCFPQNGHFSMHPGQRIRELIDIAQVPDKPGIYLIFGHMREGDKLLDIGKAGTMKRNGEFKEQKLRGRLSAKQKGMRRQDFFDNKMRDLRLDALIFYWFVTYDENTRIIPAKVEADLLQSYFDEHGLLPEWNCEF